MLGHAGHGRARALTMATTSIAAYIHIHLLPNTMACCHIGYHLCAHRICVCVIEKESYFPFAYTDTESTHTDLKLSSDRYAPYLSM